MKKLPHLLLLTLASVGLFVSLAFPAWSRVLQAQGYGDYVDLHVMIDGPSAPVVAGAALTFGVETGNAGPDQADFPALTVAADPVLHFDSSAGCADSPTFNRRCQLGLPLPAGASLPAAFFGRLDADARNFATFGVAATSAETDLAPGNEIAVLAFPIQVERDLGARLLDPHPETLPDGRLRWQVEFENFGPSSARLVRVYTDSYSYGGGSIEHQCQSAGNASCPSPFQDDGFLMPGERLSYAVTLPPLSEANPGDFVNMSIWSSETGEVGSQPEFVSFQYLDALFADGSE